MFKLHHVDCPICHGTSEVHQRFPAKFGPEDMSFTARKTPNITRFRVVQCTGCGLVFSTPVPDISTISELYREGDFISEPQLENMIGDYLDECSKYMHLCGRERLLEIGSSSGAFLDRVADRFNFAEVRGVEPCAKSVEAMPARVRGKVIADILRPGQFEPESFDCIVFFQVLDHIPDPNNFLSLIRHYLKPNGIAIALHHNIRAFKSVLLGSRSSTYDVQHMFLWDKKTMRLILNQNGFSVVDIRSIANRYQLDYAIRMLPLPAKLKEATRNAVKFLGLSNFTLRVHIENMVIAFCRDDAPATSTTQSDAAMTR